MKIHIPQNNDARRLFNPVLLVFFSVLINSLFQLSTVDYDWNSFSIFGTKPNQSVLDITILFFSFYLIGALSSYFCYYIKYGSYTAKRTYYSYECENIGAYYLALKVLFFLNLLTLAITQYYMMDANVINIFLKGSVTAQEIEDKIVNSPFAIHGLSLLIGYLSIIVFGVSKLTGKKKMFAFLNLLIVFIKFIGYAKLQSVLYLFLAILFFSKRKITLIKCIIICSIVIALFAFTRIIRNPDQALMFNMDFIMRFVGGLYFGSPIVNFSYIVDKGLSDIYYFFNWFIPQKIIPVSPISESFPDRTSPIGFIGSSFVSFGYYGVIYTYIVGFILQYSFLVSDKSPLAYVVQPFIIMACLFSMMYNNFVNMNFFILPVLFGYFLIKRLKIHSTSSTDSAKADI